jgi:GNAT superfamily N-acetyltransferase
MSDARCSAPHGASIIIVEQRPDSSDARTCLQEYFAELSQRFEQGFDPQKSISANTEELMWPAGIFLVARLGSRPVGCGALKVRPGRIGEIKRMWVSAEHRGLGLGRRILAALEAKARTLRLKVLRLETNRTLKEAQSLYRSCGYVETDAFSDEPYAHHWFEKPL